MRKTILAGAFASLGVLACSGAAAAHSSALDDYFYTYYTFDSSDKTVTYFVCGVDGCPGVGTLGEFKSACAILEGTPHTHHDIVTRAIYIFDRGRKASDQATLAVYTKTDTINDAGDTVNVTLQAIVPLGFTAGAKAHCSTAADDTYVFVGTDILGAVKVDKDTLAVEQTGFGNAAAITADERGYITVRDTSGIFNVFDRSGFVMIMGGGIYEMTDTRNAYTQK